MKLRIDGQVRNHKPTAHGGIYSSGLEYDSKIIDFSSNVNPLGYPSSIINGLNKDYPFFSVYPDSDSTRLRNYLEKYTGVSKDQIIIGNGATEIIYNFCRAFLKGCKVLIPIPTFGEYESAAKLHGAQVYFLKTMNLSKEIPKFLDVIPKNNCVFICNPNNPTGSIIKHEDMLKIVESAYKNSVLLFVDECFIEFVSNKKESIVPHLKEFDNLFVLRSLTKSFGLAGLRIGYGLGSSQMIKVLQKIKIPWNVSGFAQSVAIRALSNKRHLAKTRIVISRERKFLKQSISEINGFSCYDSSVNFLLVKCLKNSKYLEKNLLEKKILIRDCSTFRGLNNKFIRVAVRTRKENLKLIKALKKL
ncbi:Aromatic-amino-acid aminotransferase 2 [uncultured archaeon]|nr:Aromatic-amino-acid aminotransferase 2 [uncultured archaeon]